MLGRHCPVNIRAGVEMLNKLKMVGLAIVMAIAGTLASAATITFGPTPTAAIINPLADSTTGAVLENTIGSIPGLKRSPWQGSSVNENLATSYYTSVGRGASATYVFAGLQNSLSVLWGSPDTYNFLDIILSGPGGSTQTINGTSAMGPVGILAQFLTITGVSFDTLTFRSNNNAFEYVNLQTTPTPVPVPAAGFLLVGGLGIMVAMRRRRKAS